MSIPSPTPERVTIGRIVGPHGLRGEVRVYPSSDFPERFLEPGPRWLMAPNGTAQSVDLQGGRFVNGKGLYILRLAGVSNRDQAEALRGHLLQVPAADRPQLEDGEFYVADLVGLAVHLLPAGNPIGTVTDLYEAGNDLLEVTLSAGGKRVLVPFVEAIVPEVDLAAGYVAISPPPGLLEN